MAEKEMRMGWVEEVSNFETARYEQYNCSIGENEVEKCNYVLHEEKPKTNLLRSKFQILSSSKPLPSNVDTPDQEYTEDNID